MHDTRSSAAPGTNYARDIDIRARARLGFYGSGRPFIQLLSNELVNMSLLACHKLERTDKATVSSTY